MGKTIKDSQQYQRLTTIANLLQISAERFRDPKAYYDFAYGNIRETIRGLGESDLVDLIVNANEYASYHSNIPRNMRNLSRAADYMQSYLSKLAETFTLAAANAIGGGQTGVACHCSGSCKK